MAPTTTPDKLHDLYNSLTGLDLKKNMAFLYYWEVWQAEGFTTDDLICVVRYLQRKIKSGQRKIESLRFRNLIQNTEWFCDELSMARADRRNQQRPNRNLQEVLRATGRPTEPPKPKARSAEEILSLPEFKDLQALREQLGRELCIPSATPRQ